MATSLTNIAARPLPDSDLIIAAYGVVQRLILIGCYVVMGFMQGYQPVASYAFGAKNEERFHVSVRFALKGALLLTVLVEAVYVLLAEPLILLFNQNPQVVEFGKWLLISQVALYPAFGLCYMMTITFQTIGGSEMGLFLSLIRQGLFYVPFILLLPGLLGVTGIYLSQPAADILTVLLCLFLIKPMKRLASKNMLKEKNEKQKTETGCRAAVPLSADGLRRGKRDRRGNAHGNGNTGIGNAGLGNAWACRDARR